MANEQNLRPCEYQLSREEAKRGGIASGAARRRKRSMREAAEYYLSLPVADVKDLERLKSAGIEENDIDNQMALVVGLSVAATHGDARAGKLLVDILGDDNKNGTAMERLDALFEEFKNVIKSETD